MEKNVFWLLSIIGLLACSSAGAEVTVSIQAIQSRVWLQQGNSRSLLRADTRVKPGETIVTSDNGYLELRLEGAALQISSNTEITFEQDNSNKIKITELHLRKGQVCVEYRSGSSSDKEFKLNVGGTMFIAMPYSGDICAQRLEHKSSIELLKGSVRVTHFVNPNLIVLGRPGTEFRIEDNGTYRLTVPDAAETDNASDKIPQVIDTPMSPVEAPTGEKPDPATAGKPGPPADKNPPARLYTVYLFSTRSEAVAKKVNQKFKKAQHNTQIITSNDGTVTRYRVAVPGFTSLQAARNFSRSIIGKLGVKDTWIGRQ